MRYGESLYTVRKSKNRSLQSNNFSKYVELLNTLFVDLYRFFRTLNFSSTSDFFHSLKSARSFKSFRSAKQDLVSGLLLVVSVLLLGSRLLKYTSGALGKHSKVTHEEKSVLPSRGYLYAWTSHQFAHEISLDVNSTHHESGSSLVGRISGPLSRVTVSAVAAGEHTLVVTSNGALFSFGRNWNDEGRVSGQLGRDGRIYNPIRVKGELTYKTVAGVAVGMYHSVAFTRDGKVYTWGLNRRGQLGRITLNKNEWSYPGLVSGPLKGKKVIQVAAGRAHTLALTSDGQVYTWGLNYFKSQLIIDHESTGKVKAASPQIIELLATPRLVTGALSKKRVERISSGPDHWLALTADKEVYSCWTGYGPDEQTPDGFSPTVLGRPQDTDLAKPGQVQSLFKDQEVTFIAAGPGSSYAISEFALYSWGDFSANIGRTPGPQDSPDEPGEVLVLGEYVEEVSAGDGFAIAKSIDGKLFTWGSNHYGQLGRPAGLKDADPGLMDSLAKFQIVSIAAGSKFSMAICHHPSGMKPEDDIDRLVGMKVDVFYHGNIPSIKIERHRNAILQLEKDLFDRIPPEGYDNRFKNPCWFEKTGEFFCFPYFFIMGSSRCGIDDLFDRVSRSGLEGIISPLNEKNPQNPNWWHSSSFQADWYLDHFKESSDQILKNPSLLFGESSPELMVHSGLTIHGKPSQVNLAELIYAFLPGAKLVIMLRNPADRYYSAFKHFETQGGKSFSQKASDDIRMMKKCLETFDPHSCISNLHAGLKHLVDSLYFYPLQYWMDIYAPGEILLLRFEDYIQNIRGTVERVIDFLELPKPSIEKLTQIALKTTTKEAASTRSSMSEETRRMLKEFFAPHNKKLAELVKDDKFLWE